MFLFIVYSCRLHLYVSFRNSFSQLVGEEFLKYFDFSGESLDVSLRRFVRHLTPTTESLDRDQLLSHFSLHYQSCNTDEYKSAGNFVIAYFSVISVAVVSENGGLSCFV